MSVVTDVPVASFNARWNAAFAKLGLGAKPSDFLRELSNTIGPPVPSLRQVAHKLCTERRRSLSPAEAKAFRSRNAERNVQQRKRLKEETVPERAERVAAEAEQKAKAKVAAANKAEVKAAEAKAKAAEAEAKAAKAEAKAEAEAEAEAKVQQVAAAQRVQLESNHQHDVLMHAVTRTAAGGSAGRLGAALARAQNQPHFDAGLLHRAVQMLEQRQKEQEAEHKAWQAETVAARQVRVESLSALLSSSELTEAVQLRVLQAASSSAKHTTASGRSRGAVPVCCIFLYTVPYRIKYLVKHGKLHPRFLHFEHGFRAAGKACNRGKLFNSAGITPRGCLEDCSMTLLDLKELLTATADNQPADLQANNLWCEYMWFGSESRYSMGTFDNAEVSFKSGDTFRGPRFRDTVKLQSPAAARYGGTIASTMKSECYFEAYGSRDTRVLSELYINWLCRDLMRDHGFFEHRESCGEEGLRGPMRQADGALRRMYDAVRCDAVLARIFSIGQGCRMGSDGWEWD